jgi:DNA-binding NarL/FixJ family response regulator
MNQTVAYTANEDSAAASASEGEGTSPAKKARVLIVDDHPIVRQGLEEMIGREPDLTVVAGAESAARALEIVSTTPLDLAVIDITLTGANGIELIKNIRAQNASLPVLVLSMHDESLYAERALRAGAQGYVMKQEATSKLMIAIRRILDGQIYLSDAMNDRMVRKMIGGRADADSTDVDLLSDRELEVLQLIGRGRGTRQIAEHLHLSVKTIESHRAHIKEKLKLSTAPELVRFAVDWVNQQVA